MHDSDLHLEQARVEVLLELAKRRRHFGISSPTRELLLAVAALESSGSITVEVAGDDLWVTYLPGRGQGNSVP